MSKRGEGNTDADKTDVLIVIARAVKTRGLKGEIVADVLTDFPERFGNIDRLFVVSPAGERTAVELENHWFQNNRVILKLRGYDKVETAEQLRGYDFGVPESERVGLGEDEFYDWELENCRVENADGEFIGTVNRIMRTGAVDLLVVQGREKKELLIPMESTTLVEIDKEKKTIVIDPPEGLLELNQ